VHIGLLSQLVDKAVNEKPSGDVLAACCGGYAPYYHLVYLLAEHMKPCNVVELGVAHGRFLHCAALSSPENKIFGIDVARYPELDKVLAACNNVTFINKSSVPIPDQLLHLPVINILHVDTLHTYNQAWAEFRAYKHLLSDGAVVMFDDLHAAEDDVLRFFNELSFPKIQDDRLHTALGYGVMVYEQS